MILIRRKKYKKRNYATFFKNWLMNKKEWK